MTTKLLTLNVWHGGRLMEPMLAFLHQENPDILLLQEAYNDLRPNLPHRFRTIETIQDKLGYKHTAFAPAFMHIMPDLKVEQGNAVLSRFPLTPGNIIFFNEPYNHHYIDIPKNFPTSSRNLQHVVVNTPSGNLNVFNFQGVWDLDGDNYSSARKNMADVILQAIQDKTNVILADDTNAKPTNQAITRIEKHLTNTWGREQVSTFNMRRKNNPGYATAVVDMIFVGSSMHIQAKNCPNVDISDHLPLVVTLDIPTA